MAGKLLGHFSDFRKRLFIHCVYSRTMLTLIFRAFMDPAYVPPPHAACSCLCRMATCPIVHVSQESWHCQPQGWSSGEGEVGDSLAARPRTQRWLGAIRGTSHFPGFRAQRQSNFFHWEFQQLQLNMVVKELREKKISKDSRKREALVLPRRKKQDRGRRVVTFLFKMCLNNTER